MKPAYLLLLITGFYSCSTATDPSGVRSADSLPNALEKKTGKAIVDHEIQKARASQDIRPVIQDSVDPLKWDTLAGYYFDSLFVPLGLGLEEISKTTFQNCIKNYKRSCTLDASGFIKETGLILTHSCGDICESYLMDPKSGKKMSLPSAYDQGIVGVPISPSCKRFIVYSSYDGPDYTKYYGNRAEICGFNIANTNGLEGIKPLFSYGNKDWSIDSLFG